MIEFDSPDKFVGTTAALIIGGLTAAGEIGSKVVEANASKAAATTQATAANTAAAYTQGQTNKAMDYITALHNTIPNGNASPAYSTLSRLMGGSSFGSPAAPAPQPGTASGVPVSSAPSAGAPSLFGGISYGGAPAPSGPEPMITVQAPDGSTTRRVPQSQAAYWQSKGAKVVG